MKPWWLLFALCSCELLAPSLDENAGFVVASRTPDAGVDAGVVDAGAWLSLETAPQLPLLERDVLRLGEGLDVDMLSAWAVDPTARRARLFFESGSEAFDAAWLLVSEASPDGRRFTPPQRVTTDAGFVASCAVLPSATGPRLVQVSAPDYHSQVAVTAVDAWTLDDARPLSLPSGVASALSWPRFVDDADGGVWLAYRDGASVPSLAHSVDGVTFAPGAPVPPVAGGAMAAVGRFASGALAYVSQAPEGAEPMVSRVRTSADGAQWSSAQRVTDASPNVHDTFVLPRVDGDVDLYFIYPAGGRGFSLFRRALSAEGALGPEQRVTDVTLGDPSKPAAFRLSDGAVLVTFADIVARAPQGWPSRQQLVVARLAGDAPR